MRAGMTQTARILLGLNEIADKRRLSQALAQTDNVRTEGNEAVSLIDPDLHPLGSRGYDMDAKGLARSTARGLNCSLGVAKRRHREIACLSEGSAQVVGANKESVYLWKRRDRRCSRHADRRLDLRNQDRLEFGLIGTKPFPPAIDPRQTRPTPAVRWIREMPGQIGKLLGRLDHGNKKTGGAQIERSASLDRIVRGKADERRNAMPLARKKQCHQIGLADIGVLKIEDHPVNPGNRRHGLNNLWVRNRTPRPDSHLASGNAFF